MLECRKRPLAASESERSATAVATPRLSEYHPCHFGRDSSGWKSCPASSCFDSSFLQTAHCFSVGITTRSAKLSRSSGFPDGPRKIGPELGFPSPLRSSARMLVRGSIIGTGFALLSVLGEVVQTRQMLRRTKRRLPS